MILLRSSKKLALLFAFSFAVGSVSVNAKPLAPVTIIACNGGQVMTAHAELHGNIVYIDGLLDRPSFAASGAHVHVWGVGNNNTNVFFKSTSIVFTGKPSLIHTTPYVISVNSAAAAKAKTIYVTFHNVAHADAHRME